MHLLIKRSLLIKSLTYTDVLVVFVLLGHAGGDALTVVLSVSHGEIFIS